VKAKDIKVGMRFQDDGAGEPDEAVDSRVATVDHLVSTLTGATRGVIVELEDGSTIQWMDPNAEVHEVS